MVLPVARGLPRDQVRTSELPLCPYATCSTDLAYGKQVHRCPVLDSSDTDLRIWYGESGTDLRASRTGQAHTDLRICYAKSGTELRVSRTGATGFRASTSSLTTNSSRSFPRYPDPRP
eukprot:3940569-Rhodomonas_salina.1